MILVGKVQERSSCTDVGDSGNENEMGYGVEAWNIDEKVAGNQLRGDPVDHDTSR
jgi:hypothetical protein